MKKRILKWLFQWVAMRLREEGEDIRVVRDNPKGTFTFQGEFKY